MSRSLRAIDSPPDLVVVQPVRDWTCAQCQGTGGLLIMDDAGPLCLACADMDHLVFLPSGEAALTRRARKASDLSAVVVRWSRTRKRTSGRASWSRTPRSSKRSSSASPTRTPGCGAANVTGSAAMPRMSSCRPPWWWKSGGSSRAARPVERKRSPGTPVCGAAAGWAVRRPGDHSMKGPHAGGGGVDPSRRHRLRLPANVRRSRPSPRSDQRDRQPRRRLVVVTAMPANRTMSPVARDRSP